MAHPFTLEATLKHELCHLLLHANIKRNDLPKWLDEGVAQWVSGGLADIIMNKKSSVLDESILSGRYIGLKDLAEGFPNDEKYLRLAYEESKNMVEFIIREYGRNGILTLLGHLKEGDEIDSALFKSFSISFAELERRWYNRLKKRVTWLTFLINNLYEILFFLAALILVYGFVRALLRKRSYEEYEGEDNGF